MKPLYAEFRVRKAVLNIIFFLIIFTSFVLILEIVLRETHLFGARISFTCPDPLLGYSFLPGRTYWVKQENDHPIVGRINHYGWRDNEWSLERSQNTYRIAVLGDSFVESFQVERQYSFLVLVEDRLRRESGIEVELMNFGRSGYTQAEEFLVLTNYVGEFSPDMVILFFFPGNDITDISKDTAPDLMRPFYSVAQGGGLVLDTSFSKTTEFKIKSLISMIKRHSALVSLISDRYIRYRIKSAAERKEPEPRASEKRPFVRLNGYLSLCTFHADQVYLRNYDLNKTLIKAMAKYCEESRIKFMLVCCDIYFAPEMEAKYREMDPTFNPFFFEEDLKNMATSVGIEFLGLQSLFWQSCAEKNIPCHWGKEGHWNYAGHRVVADALAGQLNSFARESKIGRKEPRTE